MHKISKKSVQELANQLATAALIEDTSLLLEKVRELYESIILLHHTDIAETEKDTNISDDLTDNSATEVKENIEISEKEELSVQERIQHIMDAAPIFESETKSKKTTEPTTNEEDYSAKNEEKRDALPQTSLDDEFKDAISADFAADLFESAEKIEITKKSLNDKLSQKEIQIGLNDRIAFVKHLFNGSQTDFTRVLSQLNSFETEPQAKQFINTQVKPDYNWKGELEYEERFIALIERKFL